MAVGEGKAEKTLAAILACAADIASREGLEQVTMRRLARAVGVSKSGLYAHFASKEELQLATIDHALEVFEANVFRAPGGEPDAELGGLLARWLAFFERCVFAGGCFLIVSAVEFSHRPGAVREALEKAIDRELSELERSVGHAQEQGDLGSEVDAGQTAFELHSILMNAHALFQIKQDPTVFERARAAVRPLVGALDGSSSR